MISSLIALFVTLPGAHADLFEARVLVQSTTQSRALVALANKDTIVFGDCVMPKVVGTPGPTSTLEAFVNCKPLGEPLPNKTEVRIKLENAFKTKFARTYDDATGASVTTIARQSLFVGAVAGAAVSAITKVIFPRTRLLPLTAIFGSTTGLTMMTAGYLGARTAYAENGAADVLAEINRSKVMTNINEPLKIEDMLELGLVSRRGFKLARQALSDAITAVAFELRGIIPGGGSTGGAGASAAW